MIRHALLLGLALGVGNELSCDGGDRTRGHVNAPCTRAGDCEEGLACDRGVCVENDSDAAFAEDALSNADGATDAPLRDATELDAADGDAVVSGDR